MELYQQFLSTEDILKNIIDDAKQNIRATFKEITNALGDVETHANDDAISEDAEKQIEETEDPPPKPVANPKRKIKTSIHSAKCEHSPLNRSKVDLKMDTYKSPASLLNNPGKLNKQLRNTKNSPKQTEPKSEIKSGQINEDISGTNYVQVPDQKLSEKKRKLSIDTSDYQPLVKRASCNETRLISEQSHLEDDASSKDEKLLNLTMSLCHAPTSAPSPTNTTKSPSFESATSVPDSPTAPQPNIVNNNNNAIASKSPLGDITNRLKTPSHSTFSSETQIKHVPRLPVLATDKRFTSLENKTNNTYGKFRLFSSTEKLGGVSRLNSLVHSVHAPKPRTGSRLNSINEKVSVNSSSIGYSNKQKNPPSSVLSEKEQRIEAKRRVFIEQMEKREERLRAFQDAKKQKMEARKKANEERFLAVQQRYQQMLQGNHLQENNTSVNSVQPHNVSAKPLQTTTLPKKCIVNLNPVDHNTLKVQYKPVTTIKQPQLNSCPKPQPISKLNVIQPTKQPQTQEKVITTQKLSLINSPVINESFDISQLNSDSESEDDELNLKVPSWCRKGNPEMIAAMSDVYSNKLKWQNEFLPASMINFDIADVFRNYQYTVRPRTSSGIWNTSPGASKSSVGRSIFKKITS
ncbi:unnamed protein product [Schistosoma turkestanicum]|nr:unnamed protein product [Schistosoma turkestanicum]